MAVSAGVAGAGLAGEAFFDFFSFVSGWMDGLCYGFFFLLWRGWGGLTFDKSCYNNSTELLFAAMSLYQMRVIERLWGSRKFAVCIWSLLYVWGCLWRWADERSWVVFHLQCSSSDPDTPSSHHNRASTPHLRRCKQPPRRTDAPHLRPPRSIPRRHTDNLQVSDRHLQVARYILRRRRRPRTRPQR